MKPKLKFVCL